MDDFADWLDAREMDLPWERPTLADCAGLTDLGRVDVRVEDFVPAAQANTQSPF